MAWIFSVICWLKKEREKEKVWKRKEECAAVPGEERKEMKNFYKGNSFHMLDEFLWLYCEKRVCKILEELHSHVSQLD